MTTLISREYLQQQQMLHAAPKGYGGKGDKWAGVVEGLIRETGAQAVLDYGCGQATLARALARRGIEAHNYDPAIVPWSHRPAPRDLVVCTDVLEHVEPACIAAVLDDLAALTRQTAFVVIALVEAQKTLPDGRNAHILLKPRDWWLTELYRRFAFARYVPCREHKELATVWKAKG